MRSKNVPMCSGSVTAILSHGSAAASCRVSPTPSIRPSDLSQSAIAGAADFNGSPPPGPTISTSSGERALPSYSRAWMPSDSSHSRPAASPM